MEDATNKLLTQGVIDAMREFLPAWVTSAGGDGSQMADNLKGIKVYGDLNGTLESLPTAPAYLKIWNVGGKKTPIFQFRVNPFFESGDSDRVGAVKFTVSMMHPSFKDVVPVVDALISGDGSLLVIPEVLLSEHPRAQTNVPLDRLENFFTTLDGIIGNEQYLAAVAQGIKAAVEAFQVLCSGTSAAEAKKLIAALDSASKRPEDRPLADRLAMRIQDLLGVAEAAVGLCEGDLVEPYIDFLGDLAAEGEDLTLRLLNDTFFEREELQDMILFGDSKNGEVVIAGVSIPLFDDEGEVLDRLEFGFDGDGNSVLSLESGAFSISTGSKSEDNVFSPKDVKRLVTSSKVLSQEAADTIRAVLMRTLKCFGDHCDNAADKVRKEALIFLATG